MNPDSGVVRTVVKVGGGLLSRAGAFDRVTEALTAFTRGRRVLIVPGGGPFADAVRQMFKRIKIGDDAAHWMAVLSMDQYAYALAARIGGAVIVHEIRTGDGRTIKIAEPRAAGMEPRAAGTHVLVRPVSAEAVTDTRLASTISNGGAKVHTVEHLMSACVGLG